jgi:hypothetical protein
MAWQLGWGTIAPGTSQDWWFILAGGNGDAGPQLIQAEPLVSSGELVTVQMAEVLSSGFLSYRAVVRNDGPNTVKFTWRGGGF